MLQKLQQISHHFLRVKNLPYKRYFIKTTRLGHRMSILIGPRGVGKTTTLVQLLLEKVNGELFDKRVLYIQADHFALGNLSLYEIAEQFQMEGGKWLAIDEIHKYPNWSQELKSIYDTFVDLTLFISGSSALEIYKGTHDLARRSVSYSMEGLSFREYLELNFGVELLTFPLEAICKDHLKMAESVLKKIEKRNLKIIPTFHQYLKHGYYPYFFEIGDPEAYELTLEQNFHITIESDLAAIYPHLSGVSVKKMKQLLLFISEAVPFVPNWSKIARATEVGDIRTLKSYFVHLEAAGFIRGLSKASEKFSRVESCDKVYLNNTNQLYTLATGEPEKGTLRETFFLSMLATRYDVKLPIEGDFLVDGQFLFEVGGKKKGFEQIKNQANSFLACDGVEIGVGNKIPLWLFGFLY